MNRLSSEHDQFLALVQSHQRPLLKVCWAYGKSSHDRDDLLQEIVARLWAAYGKYDRARRFLTWMYRIALNVAIDHRRRQQRWERESVNLQADQPTPAMDQNQAKEDQLRELYRLLEQQSDADRAILLLYLEQHSYAEIGEVLGISESNVGTRLNRLKNSLRQAAQNSTKEIAGA